MTDKLDDLELRAQQYADSRSIDFSLSDKLGFGIDGTVWRTGKTAVKVFERQSNYSNEKDCYQRLEEHQVSSIYGLEVPQLVDLDDELWIVEMTIVRPPYLLDFGKACLDVSPYSADDMAVFEETYHQAWGDDWPKVNAVLWVLRDKYGIFYNDPKEGNLRLYPEDAEQSED